MDDRGQMMLLAAVVLIFAFLALSAMVSRVSQLGSVTTQDQDRPVLLEVDSVKAAVEDLIGDLQAVTPTLNATSTPRMDDTLEASLRHIAALEAARGFRFEFGDAADEFDGQVVCAGAARQVWFRLSDDQVRVELASAASFSC